MTERRDHTPTPGPAHQYKRSWKNLLINKKYQLRFTLFMVGLSSALMIGLGVWVMKVANETTQVSATSVLGKSCEKIPTIEPVPVLDEVPAVPMKLQPDGTPPPTPIEPAPEPAADPDPDTAPTADVADAAADAPATEAGSDASAAAEGDAPPRRATIQLDESSITMQPSIPPDFGAKVVKHWQCDLAISGKLAQLERGRLRILYVLIGTGLLLVLGLAIYGIKMTHKVAGPLFKVGLYFGKMRAGRFDKVYSLRKGDQLVDFYEHFKHAHAGIVQMERDDITRLRAVIAAAEAAGVGEHAQVVELRELVARKEKSVE